MFCPTALFHVVRVLVEALGGAWGRAGGEGLSSQGHRGHRDDGESGGVTMREHPGWESTGMPELGEGRRV